MMCRWIRGEKLSESDAPDVRELCNSLLNAYLVQVCKDWGRKAFLHSWCRCGRGGRRGAQCLPGAGVEGVGERGLC